MWLVRFFLPDRGVRIGVHREEMVADVTAAFPTLDIWLQSSIGNTQTAIFALARIADHAPEIYLADTFDHAPAPDMPHWLAPVDHQDIWAAGVTYERSREARCEEAGAGGDVYMQVYEAERPELFFKAKGEWAVGHLGTVGIRSDAYWNVPEPELALVMNSNLDIMGLTVGNDMSSRDIEGENPLYLPQAKIYTASCALGRGIFVQHVVEFPQTVIHLEIQRQGTVVFSGETSTGNIRRQARELLDYLGHSLKFPQGVVLMTGTGIVPPGEFTFQAGDTVRIAIDGVGELINPVQVI